MLNKRDEPIPSNAISLSAAFRRFIEHRFENLRDLEREAEKSLRSVGTHELDADTGEWRRIDLPQRPTLNALKEYDSALRQAELSFREWLDADGPKPYILDPVTREWRQISRGWTHNLPRTLTLPLQGDSSIVSTPPGNFLPGFDEDFVSPDDIFSHGPSDAQLDGVLQKVFFNENEFENKLIGSRAESSSQPPRKIQKLTRDVPRKSGPRRAARLALDALFPGGIPIDWSGEQLHRAVNNHVQKQPANFVEGRVRDTISLDTILRAAERR